MLEQEHLDGERRAASQRERGGSGVKGGYEYGYVRVRCGESAATISHIGHRTSRAYECEAVGGGRTGTG
jgi:hypothetical protein